MAEMLDEGRKKLHNDLLTMVSHVYFQPPESIKLEYPCIIYDLISSHQRYADDKAYRRLPCYSITIIDNDKNIDWVSKMLDFFDYCAFERSYISDNLSHYSFILYYL